jgi:hypothetical protein
VTKAYVPEVLTAIPLGAPLEKPSAKVCTTSGGLSSRLMTDTLPGEEPPTTRAYCWVLVTAATATADGLKERDAAAVRLPVVGLNTWKSPFSAMATSPGSALTGLQ